MKNPMDRQLEKRLSDRAVAIGREGNVAAVDEPPSFAWFNAKHDLGDFAIGEQHLLGVVNHRVASNGQ